MTEDGRGTLRALDAGALDPEAALIALTRAAHDAPTWALRLDACRGLGAIAGRAFGASWELAERAAFVLLEVARDTDAPIERAQLLRAMGRAYRNLWLMPYVHARLGDEHRGVVAAAIAAAGGLCFPALEEVVASGFLGEDADPALRLAAIAALRAVAQEARAEAAPLLVGIVRKSGRGEDRIVLAAAEALLSMLGNQARAVVLECVDRSEEPLRAELSKLLANPVLEIP